MSTQIKKIQIPSFNKLELVLQKQIGWVFLFWEKTLGLKISFGDTDKIPEFDLQLPIPALGALSILDAPLNKENSLSLLQSVQTINQSGTLSKVSSGDILSLFLHSLTGKLILQEHNKDWDQAFKKPFLDQYLKKLAALWGLPFNLEVKLIVTHDIDELALHSTRERIRRLFLTKNQPIKKTAYQLLQVFYTPLKKLFKPKGNKFLENLININKGYHIKSTYFFSYFNGIAEMQDNFYTLADKIPGLNKSLLSALNLLKNESAELGYHPNMLTTNGTPELFRESYRLLKKMVSGLSPINRNHFLNNSLHCLPHWQAAGISIDSSWGFNEMTGFAAGTARPFYMWDFHNQTISSIIELPFSVQDNPMCKNNSTESIQEEINGYYNTLKETGGFFNVIFHPTYLSDNFSNYLAGYHHFIKTAKEKGLSFVSFKEACGE